MGRPIFFVVAALVLSLAAGPLTAARAQGYDISWDDPAHASYFRMQDQLAAHLQDGGDPERPPVAIYNETTWNSLSRAERAEAVAEGERFLKLLQERFVRTQVSLDDRSSRLERMAEQVDAPDKFRRFAEGSPRLAASIAARIPPAARHSRNVLGSPGRLLPRHRELSMRQGRVPMPTMTNDPESDFKSSGPHPSLMVVGAAGLGLAAGLCLVLPLAWSSAGPGPGPRPKSAGRTVSHKPRKVQEPIRQTPQAAPSDVVQKPIIPVDRPHIAEAHIPEPLPIQSVESQPAMEFESYRASSWKAITQNEQKLISLWTESQQGVPDPVSFDEWLQRHPDIGPDVDRELLQRKLHRDIA